MSELADFINKFLNNREVRYEGDQEAENSELLEFLYSGINIFDRPDGFCKYEDKVLIIEHFEFDSSFKNKKGSTNRQELFRTSNKKPNAKEKIQIFRDEIKCNYTIGNYIDNATKNLKNHYSKIKIYKEHLEEEKIITNQTKVKVLFCIEDTTALGNINAKDASPLFLPYCSEFIEKVSSMKQIDYL